MKFGPTILTLLIFLLPNCSLSVHAQHLAWKHSSIFNSSFEENKGQLLDNSNKPLPEIYYYGRKSGVAFYCFKNRVSFVFAKRKDNDLLSQNINSPSKIQASRLEMQILNANPSPDIISGEKQLGFNNYYLPNYANGILKVNAFQTILYKNIYPQIDMLLSSLDKGIEYSFIIHPGGDPNNIKIKWEGMSKTFIKESRIFRYTDLGFLVENPAICYLDNDPSNIITTNVIVQNDVMSFKFKDYDKSKTLVIDPQLSWATYYGDSGLDVINSIDVSRGSQFCIIGSTYSSKGIATSGVFQSIFSGTQSTFIAKFDSSGNRKWCTYYGPKKGSIGLAMTSDFNQNIYAVGYSGDTTGFFATPGAYKINGHKKSEDGFIVKFDSSGQRIWGTYYGDSGIVRPYCITTDNSGKLFLAGEGGSKNKISTSGSYMPKGPGGFISCFDTSGHIIWGTYYGGEPHKIVIGPKGKIFIAGYINASDTTIGTKGVWQPKYYKGADAFVSKFDSNGKKMIWSSYYGGEGDEQITGLAIGSKGNVFITGSTTSLLNIASKGMTQTGNSFLANIDSNGARKWGRYVDGTTSGVASDSVGNAFLGASTDYTIGKFGTILASGIDTTGINSWQQTIDGSGIDISTDMKIDVNHNLYIVGNTYSDSQLATKGAYQPKYKGYKDGFIAKISTINCNTPSVYPTIAKYSGACDGDVGLYTSSKHPGDKYVWSAFLGHISKGQGKDTIEITWDSGGAGWVQLKETTPLGCSDSNKFNLSVNGGLVADFTFSHTCEGQVTQFISKITGLYSQNTRSWNFGDGITDTALNPIHTYKKAGTYTPYLSVKNKCGSSMFKIIKVDSLPISTWNMAPVSIKTAQFIPKDTTSGNTYTWYFGDGDSSMLNKPIHTYLNDTVFKVQLIATNKPGCKSSFDSSIKIVWSSIQNQIELEPINIQIYPNPFIDNAIINYSISKKSFVDIGLYDLSGEKITNLYSNLKDKGIYTLNINAEKLSMKPGTYFIGILIDDKLSMKKLIRMDSH